MRPIPTWLMACLAAAILLAGGVRTASGGEDSPWPRTQRLPANVRSAAAVTRELQGKLGLMELSAARYADWESCLRGVPVSEYGDPDRQFGYAHDERDGTGRGYMPALAVDRKSAPRKEDYLFLNFSSSGNCRSNAPTPGGTADPASASAAAAAGRRPRRRAGPAGLRATVKRLERQVIVMKRSVRRLGAASERFDEWESCVSWVPVTEYGDPDGGFGFLFGSRESGSPAHRSALAIDRSDWDDPDYMFLAFVGGDRPGRGCQDEPGEAVD